MNLNERVNGFRVASRELFNNHFYVPNNREHAWEAEERFSILEEELFKYMVTIPCGLKNIGYANDPQTQISVILRDQINTAPWFLNREIDGGSWDHPQNEVTRNAILHFECFFDWDQVGIKDNLYTKIVIAEWPAKPELIGKNALIETQYVAFKET